MYILVLIGIVLSTIAVLGISLNVKLQAALQLSAVLVWIVLLAIYGSTMATKDGMFLIPVVGMTICLFFLLANGVWQTPPNKGPRC